MLDSTIKKIILTSVTEFFLKIFHFMCPWKYLSLCFRRWLNKHEPVYQALWANNTDFDEVLISPVMIQDHMPDKVLDSLNRVSYRLESPSDNFLWHTHFLWMGSQGVQRSGKLGKSGNARLPGEVRKSLGIHEESQGLLRVVHSWLNNFSQCYSRERKKLLCIVIGYRSMKTIVLWGLNKTQHNWKETSKWRFWSKVKEFRNFGVRERSRNGK